MKRKLKNNKGFTLTEVLIAVALLAIFVSMAAVGTSGMFGTGEKMMAASKAAVLGSEVMDAIVGEIRFGETFVLNGVELKNELTKEPEKTASELTFNSASYGDGCVLLTSKGGETIKSGTPDNDEAKEETLEQGTLILQKTVKTGDTSSESYTYLPIGTAAYDEVYISNLAFTCHYEESGSKYIFKYITVTISISDKAENNVLWTQTVNIEPLYFMV